jgi:glycosyltransferase involved in cell wall biosynthesis
MNNAPPAGQLLSPANRTPAGDAGISVVIPAHNAEATLEATLNSLLRQTHTIWEAIIVDDGSTDGTYGMATGWEIRDRRFRTLQQEKSGASTARNKRFRPSQNPCNL